MPINYHHGSFGSCFSFGNKTHFGKVDDKSVGVYTNKKSNIVYMQTVIDENTEYVKEICSDIIVHVVLSLRTIIPNIKYLLFSVIDTSQTTQKVLNDVVKKVKSSPTDDMHSEKYSAYSLITVPSYVVAKNIPLSLTNQFSYFMLEQKSKLWYHF